MQEELIVRIESFSNLGYGIARVNGQVVFVENSCPEDIVKIKITKETKTYSKAVVLEIISPSPFRVKPFCAMQKICGSCQMQFIDYDFQLELKKQITKDAIRNIGGLDILVNDVIASPKIREYRHKIQYPVSQTKVSKRLLAGYYKSGTHDIVNIKHCPIQPEICDKIIDYIRCNAFNFGITGYNEKKNSGDLRHVVIRNSSYNSKNLVVLVVNTSEISESLKSFALDIYNNLSDIAGVCINFNNKKTNVIFGESTICVVGDDYIEDRIAGKTFRIGPDTFFQVNPLSAENIFNYVNAYIARNFAEATVLDAYAGITAFGICMSDVCKKVVSVEENRKSCALAKDTLRLNSIKNIEINNMDATLFFKQETRKFDIVLLDPPRKGCTKESLDEVVRLCKKKIIYVSCNPATLARDLKYLTEQKGAVVESIQPFDMFCHTYHIENVAIINIC